MKITFKLTLEGLNFIEVIPVISIPFPLWNFSTWFNLKYKLDFYSPYFLSNLDLKKEKTTFPIYVRQIDFTVFLMAPISIMFLLFFLNSMGVRAQTAKPKLIELGSSLSPTNGSSSWVSPSGHFAFGFYPQDTYSSQ